MQGFTAPTAGGATSCSGSYCGPNHLVEWHLLADVNTTVWSLGQHLMVTQPEWLYIIALIQSIIKLSSKWQTARLEVKPVTALCECLSSSRSLSSTVSAIHLPSFVLFSYPLFHSLSILFFLLSGFCWRKQWPLFLSSGSSAAKLSPRPSQPQPHSLKVQR